MRRLIAILALSFMPLGLTGCTWTIDAGNFLQYLLNGGYEFSVADWQTNAIDYGLTQVCHQDRYCVRDSLRTIPMNGTGAAQFHQALNDPNGLWDNAINPTYWDCYSNIGLRVDLFGNVNWIKGLSFFGGRDGCTINKI